MHNNWTYEKPSDEVRQLTKELAEKIGMSEVIAELLIRRGIKTESAAKRSTAVCTSVANREMAAASAVHMAIIRFIVISLVCISCLSTHSEST